MAWKKCKKSGNFLCTTCIDYTKAFNRVPKIILWDIFILISVLKKMMTIVFKIYEQILVKFNSTQSMKILSMIKMIQNYLISPILFGIFINEIEQYLIDFCGVIIKFEKYIIKALIYVDDIIFLSHDFLSL